MTQGDWGVVEFVNRGAHTAVLETDAGDFPPTGRRYEVRYCRVMRVKDGKAVEGRDYYDPATILKHFGLGG